MMRLLRKAVPGILVLWVIILFVVFSKHYVDLDTEDELLKAKKNFNIADFKMPKADGKGNKGTPKTKVKGLNEDSETTGTNANENQRQPDVRKLTAKPELKTQPKIKETIKTAKVKLSELEKAMGASGNNVEDDMLEEKVTKQGNGVEESVEGMIKQSDKRKEESKKEMQKDGTKETKQENNIEREKPQRNEENVKRVPEASKKQADKVRLPPQIPAQNDGKVSVGKVKDTDKGKDGLGEMRKTNTETKIETKLTDVKLESDTKKEPVPVKKTVRKNDQAKTKVMVSPIKTGQIHQNVAKLPTLVKPDKDLEAEKMKDMPKKTDKSVDLELEEDKLDKTPAMLQNQIKAINDKLVLDESIKQKITAYRKALAYEDHLNYTKSVFAYVTKLAKTMSSQKEHSEMILLTFVSQKNIKFANSWLCNTRKFGIQQSVIMVTLDKVARSELETKWPEINTFALEKTIFGTDLQNMSTSLSKIQIVNALLHADISMLLFDVESVWLKNPMPELVGDKEKGFDMVVNLVTRSHINSGFIVLIASDHTRAFWETLYWRLRNNVAKEDDKNKGGSILDQEDTLERILYDMISSSSVYACEFCSIAPGDIRNVASYTTCTSDRICSLNKADVVVTIACILIAFSGFFLYRL